MLPLTFGCAMTERQYDPYRTGQRSGQQPLRFHMGGDYDRSLSGTGVLRAGYREVQIREWGQSVLCPLLSRLERGKFRPGELGFDHRDALQPDRLTDRAQRESLYLDACRGGHIWGLSKPIRSPHIGKRRFDGGESVRANLDLRLSKPDRVGGEYRSKHLCISRFDLRLPSAIRNRRLHGGKHVCHRSEFLCVSGTTRNSSFYRILNLRPRRFELCVPSPARDGSFHGVQQLHLCRDLWNGGRHDVLEGGQDLGHSVRQWGRGNECRRFQRGTGNRGIRLSRDLGGNDQFDGLSGTYHRLKRPSLHDSLGIERLQHSRIGVTGSWHMEDHGPDVDREKYREYDPIHRETGGGESEPCLSIGDYSITDEFLCDFVCTFNIDKSRNDDGHMGGSG